MADAPSINYAPSTATLIAAFCQHGGRLTKREIEDALFGFDLDMVNLAMAELELQMGMTYRDFPRSNGVRQWREREYHCPMAVRLFAGRQIAGAV